MAPADESPSWRPQMRAEQPPHAAIAAPAKAAACSHAPPWQWASLGPCASSLRAWRLCAAERASQEEPLRRSLSGGASQEPPPGLPTGARPLQEGRGSLRRRGLAPLVEGTPLRWMPKQLATPDVAHSAAVAPAQAHGPTRPL